MNHFNQASELISFFFLIIPAIECGKPRRVALLVHLSAKYISSIAMCWVLGHSGGQSRRGPRTCSLSFRPHCLHLCLFPIRRRSQSPPTPPLSCPRYCPGPLPAASRDNRGAHSPWLLRGSSRGGRILLRQWATLLLLPGLLQE